MCAHKVIGMSLIALTCSAIVANTAVTIGPDTKIISASSGGGSSSDCAPRIVHKHLLQAPADEERIQALNAGNWVGETVTENGGNGRLLVQHFEDGSFKLTHVILGPGGEKQVDVYAGVWVVGNDFEPNDL